MQENNNAFSIKIYNYQSLSEADIKLESGLTIITGATNNGKSAIVRAIESAIFNDGSDDYIKAGTDGLAVVLSNGVHTAVYKRSRKKGTDKTTYQFDGGEVQQKVGRIQLPEMEQLFNIREVRLQNNQKCRLNFWNQNEKPFLMDKTAGQLYEFLSISYSEKYLDALKRMSLDIKDEETETKKLTASIDIVKKELSLKNEILDRNVGFMFVYDEIMSLRNESSCLERAERVGVEIQHINERLNSSRKRLHKITAHANEHSNLTSSLMKQMELVQDLERKVTNLSVTENAVRSTRAIFYERQSRLKELPRLKISTAQHSALFERIAELGRLNQWISLCRQVSAKFIATERRVFLLKEKIKELDAELSKVNKELVEFKNTVGVCPVCGSVFMDEHNQTGFQQT